MKILTNYISILKNWLKLKMFINKLKNIFRVKEHNDEITIIYKIDNNKIKVFDEKFVKKK